MAVKLHHFLKMSLDMLLVRVVISVLCALGVVHAGVSDLLAGPPHHVQCRLGSNDAACGPQRGESQPRCAIELTCLDKPVQIGYSDGVCFRASCPGVWAVLHKRVDQASFRRRIWTYRHYTFKGYWELKDQGAVLSGPVQLRELFLVMPDDLIEFRLRDCDKFARVELRNLGYVKRGDPCELKKWLAMQSYRNGPALIQAARNRFRADLENNGRRPPSPAVGAPWPLQFGYDLYCGFTSACRRIGIPF